MLVYVNLLIINEIVINSKNKTKEESFILGFVFNFVN